MFFVIDGGIYLFLVQQSLSRLFQSLLLLGGDAGRNDDILVADIEQSQGAVVLKDKLHFRVVELKSF